MGRNRVHYLHCQHCKYSYIIQARATAGLKIYDGGPQKRIWGYDALPPPPFDFAFQ